RNCNQVLKKEYPLKCLYIKDTIMELCTYYDPELYPSMKEQKNFETNVFNKTHKADNEIAFLEGMTIVYKSSIDLFFYVVGSAQENELMLMAVLNCLFESLSQMLRKNVEKRTLLDNMDGVFLVVDEIIDGGFYWLLSRNNIPWNVTTDQSESSIPQSRVITLVNAL
uniref:Coatomer subunit zeta n=1 Tax=Sinocyclocheilus grahami TaxID=75366 RepID=A0A672SDS8_SINGR